ncbi:MAG TPA: penicillin-binding protein 2 [Propionibacteriaceae bacterium]|nr:penicillin-binding protein 2 [Propionibacteriaceae bacterium]
MTPGRDEQHRAKPSSARRPVVTGTVRITRTEPTAGKPAARPQTAARPAKASRPTPRRTRAYKPPTRVPLANSQKRMRRMLGAMAVVMTIFIGRDFQLQAFDAHTYAVAAAEKMTSTHALLPERGTIYDRTGQVLAATEPAVKIIADPLMISRNGIDARIEMGPKQTAKAQAAPAAIAAILATHLGGTADSYLSQLTKTSKAGTPLQYVVLQRQVSSSTYNKIANDLRDGRWFGLYKEDDPVRRYPSGGLAANVVGFMNGEGQAGGGLEYSLNKQLTGTKGVESYDSAAYGRIPLGTDALVPAVDGIDFSLTLDSGMQIIAEQALAAGVAKAAAKSGMAIVLDTRSAQIFAMSTTPAFDSNSPGKAKAENIGNSAVSDAFEPGSVQKILTMAALLDAGQITPETGVDVPSRLASGDGYISDAFSHGTLPMNVRGIVANSSNIGTTLLARKMDKATMQAYLSSFGLGRSTGTGLPGEANGELPDADMPDYTRDQIAFGQGISVTAIQMAAAVAGLVNGGVYNAPTIIKSAVDGEGNPVAIERTEPRRIISPEASTQLLDLMESVITQVKGREIEGYRTAGKTGTAERYDATCVVRTGRGCYNGYTASFIGVAPAEDPQLLVYVVIDQPIRGRQGSEVALPVYQEIMTLALARYGVLPSATEAPKKPLTYK